MRSADPRPVHRIASIALLLGVELAAVGTLHRLGAVDGLAGPGADPGGWLGSASPEEVVAGALRAVGLACAWWLLASTVLYLVARATCIPGAVRTVGPATLPAIRRWVDRVVAASVLASSAVTAGASGAIAGSEAPPPSTSSPVVVDTDRLPPDEARPVPEVRVGRAVESLPGPPTTAPPAPVPPSVPAGPAGPAAPVPGRHVVATGDSLWTIAAAQLVGVTGRDRAALPEREIAPYWARVVDVNRAALRSGNPDLIYPGEIVELPVPAWGIAAGERVRPG
jgi:LysM repeat protein